MPSHRRCGNPIMHGRLHQEGVASAASGEVVARVEGTAREGVAGVDGARWGGRRSTMDTSAGAAIGCGGAAVGAMQRPSWCNAAALAAEHSGQNCRGLRYVSEFPSARLLEVLECRSAPPGKVSGRLLNSTQADSHLISCGSSHRLGRVLDALRTCGGVNSAAVPCWRG